MYENLNHLKDNLISMKRLLVEIWMFKVLLVRAYKEKRSTLLDPEGKGILVMWCQEAYQNWILQLCGKEILEMEDLDI